MMIKQATELTVGNAYYIWLYDVSDDMTEVILKEIDDSDLCTLEDPVTGREYYREVRNIWTTHTHIIPEDE